MSENKTDDFQSGQVEGNTGSTVAETFLLNLTEAVVEKTGLQILLLKDKMTGTDYYLTAGPEIGKTNHQLAEMGRNVMSRLKEEEKIFSELNSNNGQLDEIHKIVSRYEGAQDLKNLGRARRDFKKAATKFPQIKENLRQIDLAATRDWIIKQKPIKSVTDHNYEFLQIR